MDIQNITAQHPESVALSFLNWDITAPVNEKTLTAAIVAKGDDFIEELGNIIGNQVETADDYNNFGAAIKKKANATLKKAATALKAKVVKKQSAKATATASAATGSIIKNNPIANASLITAGLGAGVMEGLTHGDVLQLKEETKQPQHPLGRAVATEVKKSLFDKIGSLLGQVKDTSESVKGVFASPAAASPAAPTESKSFNKILIAAIIAVVLMLFILFKNPSPVKNYK